MVQIVNYSCIFKYYLLLLNVIPTCNSCEKKKSYTGIPIYMPKN